MSVPLTRAPPARNSEDRESENDDFADELFDADVLPIYDYIIIDDFSCNNLDEEAYWRMPPSLFNAFAAIDGLRPSLSGPSYPTVQRFPITIPDIDRDSRSTILNGIPVQRSPTLKVNQRSNPNRAPVAWQMAASSKPATQVQTSPDSSLKPKLCLEDVIFVSIDFEGGSTCAREDKQTLTEIGIATLDTRDLNDPAIVSTDTITSQQYYVGERYKSSAIWPQMFLPPMLSPTFLFGKHSNVSLAEGVRILKRLFYLDNEAPEETRKVVLVGHGLDRDVKVMKRLGIDLEQAPCLLDIIDTSFLAMEVYGRSSQPRLEELVKNLGMSGKNFHIAGNDANFTLRAMLLLACRGSKMSKGNKRQLKKVWKYLRKNSTV
jgi:hypothetical protein